MSDERPAPYNDVTALHEHVRQAAEAHLGKHYRVTRIEQSSASRYAPTLESQDEIRPKHIVYILEKCTIEFAVEAVKLPVPIIGVADRATTHVQVRYDGQRHKLHIGNIVWSCG